MATVTKRECVNDEPLKATHEGQLPILDRHIPCAVLEGNIRVLSGRGFRDALGHSGNAKSAKQSDDGRSYQLPTFLAPSNLKPFIPKGFTVATISYRPVGGGPVIHGYEASAVPKVCSIYLNARRAGALKKSQLPMADVAECLILAFADVGIAALIDEATGFQESRDRLALQRMFNAYLRPQFAAWSMAFYPEFYKRLFKLRGWKWDPANPACGPRYLAQLTKDLIYERLAPGVLEELERRNPVVEAVDGERHRKAKHHQWLTEDVGRKELEEHLRFVMRFMRFYHDWGQFKRAFDRACPKPGSVGVQLDFGDLPGIDLYDEAA